MAKFKVGDRVRVKLVGSPLWREYYGRQNKAANVVAIVVGEYYVKLDTPEYCDDGHWYANEREIEPLPPAVPDGWTPASEPPDNHRDMHVMLNDGEKRFGWYVDNALPSGKKQWYLHPKGTTPKSIDDTCFDDTPAAPGEVIAWREIEPAAPVRYAVTYKGEGDSYDFDDENCYSTLESATQAAKRQSVDANKPAEIWKLVAIVNPPAEPEVIRMEE